MTDAHHSHRASRIHKAVLCFIHYGRKKALIDYLAANPKAGDIMEGTGGIRKLRWARGNKGKSGGARVIYYYHDQRIPLFLLTAFGKNEQANLSKSERNQLAKLVDLLVTTALENLHD